MNKTLKRFNLAFNLLSLSKAFKKFNKTDETLLLDMNNVDKSFNINNINNHIIQGLTKADKYILITAYSATGDNSKVFIYDEKYNFIKESILYNNAHVGGITYDSKNKNVWITDKKGSISAYKLEDIINSTEKVEPIYKRIDVSENLINVFGTKAAAYISFFDNKLFVGNFNNINDSFIKVFNVNKDGSLNNELNDIILSVPASQGLTFYKKGNNTYLLVSSSFGFHIPSHIRIVKYHEGLNDLKAEPSINLSLPPMLEQIYIDSDKLLAVFESNAKRYKSKRNNTPDFIEISLEYIIDEIEAL